MKHSDQIKELKDTLMEVPEKSKLSIWHARMAMCNLVIPLLEDYEKKIVELEKELDILTNNH